MRIYYCLQEMVGECMADYYNVQGIKIISVKRYEFIDITQIKILNFQINRTSFARSWLSGWHTFHTIPYIFP